jgi:hypothetical protein
MNEEKRSSGKRSAHAADNRLRPVAPQTISDQVAEQLKDVSVIERAPNMEGRFLSAILAPGHTKQQTAKEPEPAPAEQGTANA